jgi:hypothetical protein
MRIEQFWAACLEHLRGTFALAIGMQVAGGFLSPGIEPRSRLLHTVTQGDTSLLLEPSRPVAPPDAREPNPGPMLISRSICA